MLKIMFKRIKEYFNNKKRIEELEKEIAILENNADNPEKVVAKVMKRDLKFVNTDDFSENAKMEYYNGAKEVLSNNTLINEIKQIIDDQINFIAGESENHSQTRDARFTILAFDLLEKRLKGVANPTKIEEEQAEVYIEDE